MSRCYGAVENHAEETSEVECPTTTQLVLRTFKNFLQGFGSYAFRTKNKKRTDSIQILQIQCNRCQKQNRHFNVIIGSAEALPILCVRCAR